MKLSECIKTISTISITGSLNKEIVQLSQDSREMLQPNSLYAAVVGTQVDGHDFIQDVSDQATAIVCEVLPNKLRDDITYIQVKDSRIALGEIAACFYGTASQTMKVIAVTGTNGKTSVVHYCSQALQELKEKTLLLSTAGDYFDGEPILLSRKAPSSLETIELHRTLNEYYKKGATHVCLEATSQGLHQYRLAGVNVDIAIFTNLDQDHLDYHHTMEEYAQAKKMLFDNLSSRALVITNYDDAYGKYMVSDTAANIVSYGLNSGNEYTFSIDNLKLGAIEATFNNQKLLLPVIGRFNVYNILAVYAVLCELQYEKEMVLKVLETLRGVPGRMDQVENDKKILVLVDYAHSTGALENVLSTLKELPHNHIRTVVGCGGDRDTSKRAPMSKVSQGMSDHVIFTSDNPRTEEMSQIFEDMKKGLDSQNNNYEFIESREEAIKKAIFESEADDIVLIAGKGHEDYQIIGTTKHHFDDREMAEKYLTIK